MRFTFAEAMTDPSFYLPLAQAAEAAGYTSITVPDSIAYPEVSDAKYPYTPDGDRSFLEDKAFLETFIAIAAMGAVTSTLRFTPFVLKLPIRPPALVAKQLSSVAYLTGNRVSLGVGSSPWPEDYDIMGVDFARRGKRMNECMDIIRGLTAPPADGGYAGDYFEFHGEFYDIPKIKMSPVPSQPVPLLVGGHADAALRRAAVRGDGWMHGGGDPDELDALLARISEIRAAEGVESKPFDIHVISMDGFSVDGCRRLADKGVTDVIVGFRLPYVKGPDPQPLQEKTDALNQFADSVISKVNP